MTESLERAAETAVPVVAVVGRPNVGKSTLVNRILGRRAAVVEDVPGVTRDRVAYDAEWAGRRFVVVDTGGWEPDVTGMAARVAEQAAYAMETADAVVVVVDATVGATEAEEAMARILRRGGRPVLLVANKVDDARVEAETAALWSLGLGEPHPVSALHGRGSGDLLDAVVAAVGNAPPEQEPPAAGPRRVALVGRPNVGKSSLLNQIAGEERALVDETAGTTRDPVDTMVTLGTEQWRFVDTAGIKRRSRQQQGADYYATLRTERAIADAEVAVVLLDASVPLTEQDTRVVTQVVTAGKALVLAFNKWDLVDDERRPWLEREFERELRRVQWAPRVNISALTGRRVDRLAEAMRTALSSWDYRVSTGRLNQWLQGITAAQPPPVRGGRSSRILFATQASNRPPTLVLFTTGGLEPGYLRFLERRFREDFDLPGTPVRIEVRQRKRRSK